MGPIEGRRHVVGCRWVTCCLREGGNGVWLSEKERGKATYNDKDPRIYMLIWLSRDN